ncbi:MAG: PDZ domain-containing protein, partial [Pseudomonadota bacterium]
REVNIEGISFAIPVNLVSGVVQSLRQDGRVRRGWLGLTMRNLTTLETREIQALAISGVRLTAVTDDGPAAQAGLAPGDVLVRINGEPIGDAQTGLLRIAAAAPGTALALDYLRNGELASTRAIAGDRDLASGR